LSVGKSNLPLPTLSLIESLLLDLLSDAEQEWDVMGADHSHALRAVCTFRQIGAIIAKRSIGIRTGATALGDFLDDYEKSIRDTTRLRMIRESLQQFLGEDGFKFNLIETYGQPKTEHRAAVSLESDRTRVLPLPAPRPTNSTPGHDMPSVEVGEGDPPSRMPLTFDFFMALRLRREGCAGSSLPASVRAALDRVRHRYAGTLSRSSARFVDGRAKIIIQGKSEIILEDTSSPPVIMELTPSQS